MHAADRVNSGCEKSLTLITFYRAAFTHLIQYARLKDVIFLTIDEPSVCMQLYVG